MIGCTVAPSTNNRVNVTKRSKYETKMDSFVSDCHVCLATGSNGGDGRGTDKCTRP